MSDKSGDAAVQQSERAGDTVIQTSRETARRTAEQAREGVRPADAASEAGTQVLMRAGASLAEAVRDISNAWMQYGEEVMRQSSEACQALIGCRSPSEMFEVQSRFLRGNLQAFLDQSTKLADIAGRMAKEPYEAMQQASSTGSRR